MYGGDRHSVPRALGAHQNLCKGAATSVTMPFQILSLSGGGYLGLYTISVVAELERQIRAPIASRFDLIAGTSVGGPARA
jgi:predicted acylesterase/phospholipase RssA